MPEFLSDEWLDALGRVLDESTAVRELAPLVIEQVVHDVPERGTVRYSVVIEQAGVRIGQPDDGRRFDIRITTGYPTAAAIASGTENAQAALARGRLRLGGDVEALASRSGALAALGDATAALRRTTTFPPDR